MSIATRLALVLALAAPVWASAPASPDEDVLVHVERGLEAFEQGKANVARRELHAAAAVHGASASVSVVLGRAQMRCGKWDDAVQTLEAVQRAGAPVPDLAYHLGVACFHVGRDTQCASLLGRANLHSPEARATARYYRGLALARLGRTTEARAQLVRRTAVAAIPLAESTAARDADADVNAILEEPPARRAPPAPHLAAVPRAKGPPPALPVSDSPVPFGPPIP